MNKTKSDNTIKRNNIVCTGCGKSKSANASNYFKDDSVMYRSTGFFPLCKQCTYKIYDDFIKRGKTDYEATIEMCRKFDRPFIHDLYISTVEKSGTGNKVLGLFFKNVAMNQYKNAGIERFEHSIFQTEKINVNNYSYQKDEIKQQDRDEELDFDSLEEKWGYGYNPEELKLFEKKWIKLIDNYGQKTAMHTEGLKTYIRFRVKEEMATARGEVKEAKEWGQLASNASRDAKLNVNQLSKSDISGGVDTISQLFEAVENEAGIIPWLPKLHITPSDEGDLIIWANINYGRRLEDKGFIQYKDIWNFYNEMLNEYFNQQGFKEEQKIEFKKERNKLFRDLQQIYVEPVYENVEFECLDGED